MDPCSISSAGVLSRSSLNAEEDADAWREILEQLQSASFSYFIKKLNQPGRLTPHDAFF